MSNIQTFDFNVNLLQSILWQYDETTNLLALVTDKNTWMGTYQTEFWANWVTNVFNLQTANLFGLSVWSVILGIPLFIPLRTDPAGKPIFGFNAYDPTFPTLLNTYLNFNNSNFSVLGSTTVLTIDEQRWLLRLRYYQLCNRGAVETLIDIPEGGFNDLDPMGINNFLFYLSSTSPSPLNGLIWVLDNLDMTMTYVFNFVIPRVIREILVNYDLLPRPAGVGLNYFVLKPTVFGFGLSNQNFANSNFLSPFI